MIIAQIDGWSMTNVTAALKNNWIVKQNLELNGLSFSKRRGGMKPIISTKTGGPPIGVGASVGDIVYLYETGFVYEEGIVITADPTLEFKSLSEVVDYYHSYRNTYRNMTWWGQEILGKAYNAIKEGKSYFVSVRSIETKVFQSPVFVGLAKYKGEARWRKITEEIAEIEAPLELNTKVPGSLKFKLIEQLNLSKERFHLDIDHFVPKSLNGPGNIEENLIPLDLSANRGKSNRVPKGLFIVAFQTPWFELLEDIVKKKVPSDYLIISKSGDNFINDLPAKDLAKVIAARINRAAISLEHKRKFYQSVRKVHFPNFNFTS